MQAARSVDENRIASFGLARGNGVEHDGGRIGALARANDVDAGACRPDLELLDRRRAERIGRADERILPFAPDQMGQLADRRGLARPVDADDERHLRPRGDDDGPIDRAEHAQDLLLDQIAQAAAVGRSRLDRCDDAIGRRDADVRRDEQLLERVDRLDVDRPRAALRRVGAADDLVEAPDDVLFRP